MRNPCVIAKWTLGLMLFAAASTTIAATAVNTIPAWDGSTVIHPFGVPDTQTYGQLVTVPAGETSLTSFRFVINDQGTALTCLAEVYQWDTVNNFITGPNLFESAPITTIGANAFQPYTVTIPGGAPVTAGQVYVIFFTTSKSAQTASDSNWGWMNTNLYSGGNFVFSNNGNNFALLSTTAWSTVGVPGNDLAFAVGFGGANLDASLVPTLSGSMLLMLAGALALVGTIVLRFRTS